VVLVPFTIRPSDNTTGAAAADGAADVVVDVVAAVTAERIVGRATADASAAAIAAGSCDLVAAASPGAGVFTGEDSATVVAEARTGEEGAITAGAVVWTAAAPPDTLDAGAVLAVGLIGAAVPTGEAPTAGFPAVVLTVTVLKVVVLTVVLATTGAPTTATAVSADRFEASEERAVVSWARWAGNTTETSGEIFGAPLSGALMAGDGRARRVESTRTGPGLAAGRTLSAGIAAKADTAVASSTCSITAGGQRGRVNVRPAGADVPFGARQLRTIHYVAGIARAEPRDGR
jgi:hypothetical protein